MDNVAQNIGKEGQQKIRAVGNAVGDMKDTFADVTQHATDSAKQVLSKVTESGKQIVSDYAEKGQQGLEAVEKFAREKPLTTVLLSAFAGMVLAKMMRR